MIEARPYKKQKVKWKIGKKTYHVLVHTVRVRAKTAKIVQDPSAKNTMPHQYYWVDWNELTPKTIMVGGKEFDLKECEYWANRFTAFHKNKRISNGRKVLGVELDELQASIIETIRKHCANGTHVTKRDMEEHRANLCCAVKVLFVKAKKKQK